MRLQRYDLDRGAVTFRLVLEPRDLDRVQLDDHDWMVLQDCCTDDAGVADTLLALELIARRLEEVGP